MEFKKYKLKDLITIFNRQRIPLSGKERSQMEKIYPYYGAQGIIDYVDDYIFDGKYILIAEDGENLRSRKISIATIARGKFWVNNHAHIIKNNDKSDFYFLYYYIYDLDVSEYLTGSVQPKLNKKNLENIIINAPSLRAQQKIGRYLRMLDKKNEINNAVILNLEELAQTLFKRWFVDFEFPNEDGKPYKSSGGKMVESELGMIPEGWEVKELKDIVQHSKKIFNPKIEKQVEVAHFSVPAYDSQQYPIIEDSKTIKSNKYHIDDNSVMFSRMNPKTPRTWLPNIQYEYINVCSSEYVVLDTSLYSNKGYIYTLIKNDDFNNYLINNATGSTNSRQRVRPVISLQYTFPFNKNVMRKFELKIEAFYKEIINLREEIHTLTNLRDTLLPKLLSGEIELSDEEEVK